MPNSIYGSMPLRKGAIVAIDSHNPLASVIIFQYNPSALQRTLQARMPTGDDGARAEALRLGGAPVETISLEIELDATGQLTNRNPHQRENLRRPEPNPIDEERP